MAKGDTYASLSADEKRLIQSKMIFLTAHLELIVELADELEDVPIVWKYKLKQKGADFRKEVLKYLDEVLGISAPVGTPLLDLEGKQVGTTDDVQEQAWPIIKRIGEMNKQAMLEFSNLIKDE